MHQMGVSSYKEMEFGSLETILGCAAAGMGGRTLLPMSVVDSIGDLSKLRIKKFNEKIPPTCIVCS